MKKAFRKALDTEIQKIPIPERFEGLLIDNRTDSDLSNITKLVIFFRWKSVGSMSLFNMSIKYRIISLFSLLLTSCTSVNYYIKYYFL